MSAEIGGEPGGRPPAPGRLRLLQRFLNTVDLEPSLEILEDGPALAGWLREAGLPAGRPPPADAMSEDDVRDARSLREALRDLLEARSHPGVGAAGAGATGEAGEAAAGAGTTGAGTTGRQLDSLMERYPLVPAVAGTRLTLRPAGDRDGGVRAALGHLLALAVLADADGSLTRLKVCAADRCRWVFYDASRNRSGTWCTMSICGSRAKARDYRERRVRPTAP